MSMKNAMATALGALLTVSAMSALAQDTRAEDEKPATTGCCLAACAKHAAANQASGKMRCSLTGQTMETCCCIQREGKVHCTLANKDVETCCCTPESDETDATDKATRTDRADMTDRTDRTDNSDKSNNTGTAENTATNE